MDDELSEIRRKKADLLKKTLDLPKNVIHLKSFSELKNLMAQFLNKIVIIDFSAVWCGPCQTFAPTFERLQTEFKLDFIFTKVDVDEARDIAQSFKISAVPTTVFIKSEKIIQKIEGALDYNRMKGILLNLKQKMP